MAEIQFDNGIQLELRLDGERFLGLGAVRAGAVELRSPRRPILPALRTPDGVELIEPRLRGERKENGGVRLDFSLQRRSTGLMEWMVHTVRQRCRTDEWTRGVEPAPDTGLTLELKPVDRTVNGKRAVGFSYRYLYRSAQHRLYKILDRATWEPGGRAVGNALWLRNAFVSSRCAFTTPGQFYSSEWYLPSIANPNIFQFVPLQTEMEGFTFTAGEQGTLVTWATQVWHTRTLLEKPRDCDEIVHWHEHCSDLGNELSTPVMEVLWFPGGLDWVGQANLYEDVKNLVHETLHSEIGFRRERVQTYGQMEEWENPDLRRYTKLGLPKLLKHGCRIIGLANHFGHNMNLYGVSNMCCTVDLRIPESVGEENLKALCEKAKAGGAFVEMWGNTSLSTLAKILDQRNGREGLIRFQPREGSTIAALDKSKDPFVRNPSNALEADHYTPSFMVMNLRDPVVRQHWLDRWRDAHDRLGLGGIFLDSSFNLSSDKFHWIANTEPEGRHGATADQTHLLGNLRPGYEPPAAVLSQYRAHLSLMAEMQRMGYIYCNEDTGVFGIHRHGPGTEMRLECLPVWNDCLTNFNPADIRKAGADPAEIFFKSLAYRQMWMLCWDIPADRLAWRYGQDAGPDNTPAPEQLAMFPLYNRIEPHLRGREILPDEAGVIYRGGERQVLWAFRKTELPLGKKAQVEDLTTGESVETDRVVAQPRHVYAL